MKNFYFTFGPTHQTLEGITMKGYYVKVTAENYKKS